MTMTALFASQLRNTMARAHRAAPTVEAAYPGLEIELTYEVGPKLAVGNLADAPGVLAFVDAGDGPGETVSLPPTLTVAAMTGRMMRVAARQRSAKPSVRLAGPDPAA